MRQKTYLIGLLMLLAVFAACKGESPTAPPTSTSGGGVPTTGAAITLSASPSSPVIPNTTVITATVTVNNQPVPNGTAVEFSTDFGSFSETGTASALRTTTNGVATVTLASGTAGKATIQAVVNNVTKTTTVTFTVQPPPQCPPDCPAITPTITNVVPAFGSPAGGETVTITGTNFTAPVRVFFDFGTGTTPKEAFVVSRSDTQVVVTSPPVDLGTGQTKNATIVVITGAGTSNEKRASSASPYVYQAEVLTPTISTVSPDSGPIDGGTRITIFGSGFQAPVQVSFAPGASNGAAGWTAIQVVSVRFDQIVAVTPPAREVNPNGSGVLTGAVDVRVRNITSNTEAVKGVGFSYKQKMQITAAGPTQGPISGGTKVVIDGIGFNDPVAVSIAGYAAQPIKVTGTQVTAITSAILPTTCADVTDVIKVTNIDNGDSANGPSFTYKVPKPAIFSVSPGSVTPGTSITVKVANGIPGTTSRLTLGDKVAFLSGSTYDPTTGILTLVATVPNSFTFSSGTCTVGSLTGTALQPVTVDVTYLSVETGCTDTAKGGLTVIPPSSTCSIPATLSAAPPSGSTLSAGTSAAGSQSATHPVVQISNAASPSGGAVATGVVSATITGTNAADFQVVPTGANIAPGGNQNFTINFTPGAVGPRSATLTFTTNDPAHSTFTYTLNGDGT